VFTVQNYVIADDRTTLVHELGGQNVKTTSEHVDQRNRRRTLTSVVRRRRRSSADVDDTVSRTDTRRPRSTPVESDTRRGRSDRQCHRNRNRQHDDVRIAAQFGHLLNIDENRSAAEMLVPQIHSLQISYCRRLCACGELWSLCCIVWV